MPSGVTIAAFSACVSTSATSSGAMVISLFEYFRTIRSSYAVAEVMLILASLPGGRLGVEDCDDVVPFLKE